MSWKRLALILVVAITACVAIGYCMSCLFCGVNDISIGQVVSDPQSFDGAYLRLRGYVVNTSVYMFGPKYVLRNFDNEAEIALGGKNGPEKVDLEPYISFVFDGGNYTQIRNIQVNVVGCVRYTGPVVDGPSFHLDVEEVEPSLTRLENVVTEFLKTTDVSNNLCTDTVEIKEVYAHNLGGEVIVVKYTTANTGHPHFMCEAIEHHNAVITLNEKWEVVCAFCVWSNFHDDKIWDLINQRWIQK